MKKAIAKPQTILGIREARKVTSELRDESGRITADFLEFAAKVNTAINRGIHKVLEMTERDWMQSTFEESASKIFRCLKIYRDLKGLPPAEVAKIVRKSEGNGYDLARVPEKLRTHELVEDAKKLPNKDFHQKVVTLLTDKNQIPDEPEEWFRRKWPVTMVEGAAELEQRVARIFGIDLEAKPGQQRMVWAMILEHINSLEDADIRHNLGEGQLVARRKPKGEDAGQ